MDLASNASLREVHQWSRHFLERHGHDPARSQHLLQWLLDMTLTDWVLRLNQPLSSDELAWVHQGLNRLVEDEPIQYIVGYGEFMGDRFKVTPSTLIPREETSGLIQIAQELLSCEQNLRILDIGTGSGILAIQLARTFKQAQVTALDISIDALEVAKENAEQYGCQIHFLESDLCQGLDPHSNFDLIVSNPPYISLAEEGEMDASVRQYEPPSALYADQQGLYYYYQLAEQLPKHIQDASLILLEIGYRQGPAVQAIFQDALAGRRVSIRQDWNGLDRYVIIEGVGSLEDKS
ncbi:peptide chain release factor N(5)-glutamine methyltransferase [Hutsoniella sourekii]